VLELRDRVVVLETKAAIPAAVAPDPDVAALQTRLTALEHTVDSDASRLEVYSAALQRDLAKDGAQLGERIAVLETRAPVPGPAGQPGHDGTNGTDGVDGLGFDDLDVRFDGYNMLTFAFARAGAEAKEFPVSLPFLRYQGVHQHSQKYYQGDVVTWAGSTWHCNEPTTAKPDDGSKAWQLMVKRGRDGKDGRDAPGALPVVSIGGPR
jgi:integrin beta 3